MSEYRILITGSRHWTDRRALVAALCKEIVDGLELHDQITVVHGNAKGADLMARGIALDHLINEESHPADWDRCASECDPTHRRRTHLGTRDSYCPTAGLRRNAAMVALGAQVCLGFPLGASRGTRHCMRLAREAGIRVIDCGRPG